MSSFLYFPFLLVGQPSFAMPCHASTHIALKPVLYTFLFLLLHADDDGAERQRSDIPDTDASELVS